MIGKLITPIAAFAAAVALAAPAQADPAQDSDFIDRVGEYVEIVDAPTAVDVAQAVCKDLANGDDPADLSGLLQEYQDVQKQTADAFVQVAADVYCPEANVKLIKLPTQSGKTKVV